MTIIFLGPQGAGKGTQAELLAHRHHLAHIETGAMLRQMAAQKSSAFGRRVARIIDEGKLVPFTWVLRLMEQKIRSLDPSRGIVIDGSPRRVPEARSLLRLLSTKFGRKVTRVYFITIGKQETIRRLSKRWVCVVCHRSLIMGKDVKKPTDRCPYCGGQIKRRADETPAAIAKRLAIYEKETRPVVALFRQKNVLVTINGKQTIEEVYKDIERIYQKNLHG